jgi:hypothetical protein
MGNDSLFLPVCDNKLIINILYVAAELYGSAFSFYICRMEKLKKRWDISSNWQVVMILFVFAITGSSSVYVARPLLEYLGFARVNFSPEFFWGGISYYAIRILTIFPTYQLLLVTYGWIFGQSKFFWNFEKNMLNRLGFSRILK